MTISVHAITATAYPPTGSPISLNIVSSGLTLDETWSPYVQGSLEIVTPSVADYERLDPWKLVRVTVNYVQSLGTTNVITADLVLRTRETSREDGRTSLTIESDETLLQDIALVANAPIDIGLQVGTTVRALVGYVLGVIGAQMFDGLTAAQLYGKNLILDPSAETATEAVVRRNLHLNPGFEYGGTNPDYAYGAVGSTVVRSSNLARTGTQSCRIQSTGATGWRVGLDLNADTNSYPVTPGETYFIGAYLRGAPSVATRAISVVAQFYDGANNLAGAETIGTTTNISNAAWGRVILRVDVPQNAKYMKVLVRAGVSAAADIFYLDDILIRTLVNNVGGMSKSLDFFDDTTAPTDDARYTNEGGRNYTPSVQLSYVPKAYEVNSLSEDLAYITSTTTSPFTGTRSARARWFATDTPAVGGDVYGLQTFDATGANSPYTVETGKSYVFSAYVRCSKSQRISLEINDGSGLRKKASPVVVAANTWTRVSHIWTAAAVPGYGSVSPVGFLVGHVSGTGSSAMTAGDTLDIDGVMFYEGNALVPYWDGNSAPTTSWVYGWRGEPNNSVSVRNYPNSPLVNAESAIWSPGQSAWDFITPLVQQAGRRVFADEIRTWRIIDDGYYIPGTVTLAEGTNLAAAQDSVSRNDEDSFDAVIIEYRWTDAEGNAQSAYDYATTAGYSKVKYKVFQDTPYPGPGAAAAVLSRGIERARSLNLEAVSNYDVRPTNPASVSMPGFVRTGVVSRVSWSTPSNRMSVGVRSLIS